MDELMTLKEAQSEKMIQVMDNKISQLENEKQVMMQEFQQQMAIAEKRFQKEFEKLEKQSRHLIHL